ncbi:Cysteine-rich secretory protein family protein [Gracilibacillus ureilyticus]|uniref:Cysteine-rich secretory protein family protein n=1 Tax=Gracilibacillus ureilyticus TaxID=531814 RepID=A0A1H9TIK9_9BACI|nr:CAP-associated domain-containing protein [Gracilibacillus ureilyticus]SER96958.1 Cysteine-rich secretory protein family protein [Gracilibacillus ureilyticus]
MKKILIFLLIAAAIGIFFIFYEEELYSGNNQYIKMSVIDTKTEVIENHPSIMYNQSLWRYIGKNIDEFEKEYGEASRTDSTLYGYEWKIYQSDDDYVQVGVADQHIVTLYTNSKKRDMLPFAIGMTSEELKQTYKLVDSIEFDHLRFKLTSKDVSERPVIQLEENIFAQLFIDTFTDKIAGIRFMDKKVFELHKPYEVYYYGEIKEPEEPSDQDWGQIEKGMENQIYDITNAIRTSYGVSTLQWDEKASIAAKAHSTDMKKQNYFSHYRLNGDGLQERLLEAGAYYFSAGENIAAHYVDVPAVMHGWLNSEGHREALLKEDYTHLGVGVYRLYYTQNFLEK